MQDNDYSIRATGNGHILVYHHNDDIIQFFGPPYSSPSVGSIVAKGKPSIFDFTYWDKPIFVREIEGTNVIHEFLFHDYVSVKDITFKYKEHDVIVYQACIKSGTYIFFSYPLNKPIYYNIVFSSKQSDNVVMEEGKLTFYGNGCFAIIGGEDYADTIIRTEEYIKSDRKHEKEISISRQANYVDALMEVNKQPVDVPMRDALMQTIKGTITALISQQDKEGGVIAGYPYHLGYVRDQFGIVKAMFKLGMGDEAFKLLYFFLDVFKREGRINNAQGLGIPGVLHVHENDDVEITGYIVLMFFDCYDYLKTEDEKRKFFEEFIHLLTWAVSAQAMQVINGMLPFNGDETYIAGGILPRNAIYDGSSEATILFIESANKFIYEVVTLGYDCDITYIQEKVNECMSLFESNFIQDGKLITNNPSRVTIESMPRFRHGVCEGYCGHFGWSEKSESGLFLCIDCLKRPNEFVNERKIYALKSVLLLPLFIDSSFIKATDLIDEIYEISTEYIETGELPSLKGGNKNLGYDFGFMLNALNVILMNIEQNDKKINVFAKAAFALYKQTLELVDETYTFCEYYVDKRCSGTQYRPWESAINIKALIEFAAIFDRIKNLI